MCARTANNSRVCLSTVRVRTGNISSLALIQRARTVSNTVLKDRVLCETDGSDYQLSTCPCPIKLCTWQRITSKISDKLHKNIPDIIPLTKKKNKIKHNKKLAIANRSRVSCAHDTLKESIGINITP